MTEVKAAFQLNVVSLNVRDLRPSKELHPRERKHPKYQQIAASLATVGLVEPLIVFPAERGYRVLDGHKRLDILRSRKVEKVDCVIGTADDTYTYNRRVNYLSTIGELRWDRLEDRLMGLVPHEFKALVATRAH